MLRFETAVGCTPCLLSPLSPDPPPPLTHTRTRASCRYPGSPFLSPTATASSVSDTTPEAAVVDGVPPSAILAPEYLSLNDSVSTTASQELRLLCDPTAALEPLSCDIHYT
jgi:hypothetical protein